MCSLSCGHILRIRQRLEEGDDRALLLKREDDRFARRQPPIVQLSLQCLFQSGNAAVAYEDVQEHGNRRRFAISDLPRQATGTGVVGQVLRLNDQPLANVTVSIGAVSARTDAAGRFSLRGIAPGRRELVVDGLQGATTGRQYGKFVVGVDVEADTLTEVLPVYLPQVRATDWIPVSSPTQSETVLTHPDVPGMEIHIPKGVVFRDRDGSIVTKVALVPLPLDRAPFPFPANAPVYVSVQPGGMVVQGLDPQRSRGIRVIYPNLSAERPSALANFWRYDPKRRGWYIYGTGRTSADGRRIVPDAGVELYDSIGFMYTPGEPPEPPSEGPPPQDDPCSPNPNRGDPVNCSTGLFLHTRVDLEVADIYPARVERTYRPGDTVSRAFGYGSAIPFNMYLYFPTPGSYQAVDLVLANGTRIPYTRISPGTGFVDAVFEHAGSPSSFYKSRIVWAGVGSNGWHLRFKDGSEYRFTLPGSTTLTEMRDRYGNALIITRNQ